MERDTKRIAEVLTPHNILLCIFEKGGETKSIRQVLPFLGYFLPIE